MDLTEGESFDPVEPPITDSSKWMTEYGAVKIENHGIELVWGIHSTGLVSAGKGGWIRCHLNDPLVEPVENDDIPMDLKMSR